MKKCGLYIVIEGVDGAGKDLQESFLHEYLPEDTVYTREPRGTEMGVDLRDIITGYELDQTTEILLFFAARNELLQKVVRPALEEGKHVVSNRNELTTYAYQIHAHERHDLEPFVNYMSEEITDKLSPDFVIYYDIPVDVRKERLKGRDDNNRFDNFDEEFFERARVGYKQYITKYPHVIIDASGTPEEIKETTKQALTNILERHA